MIFVCSVQAQKIDSIFFNLYTDSLKKGTYNYINVIGKLPNGSYRPLDSTQIVFTSSYGKFYGNSLWLPAAPTVEKVNITVASRRHPVQTIQHTLYIKKADDPEDLKTMDDIMSELPRQQRKKKH